MDYPAPDPLSRFEDDVAPVSSRRRPSRRTMGVVASGAAALLITGALTTTVVVRAELSTAQYASAAAQFDDVVGEYNETVATHRALETAADSMLASTDAITAAADPGYVDPAATASFASSVATLRTAAEQPDAPAPLERRSDTEAAPAPEGTEERFAAAEDLAETNADLAEQIGTLEQRIDALRPLLTAVQTGQTAFFTSVVSGGDAIRAANPDATKQTQNELQYSLHPNGDTGKTISSGGELAAYIAAAKAVQESQAAGLTERAGPDWPVKAEIIAFANSIAGGTPLDVSFSETITIDGEPYGESNSGAGLATWRTDWDRLGTIELTNSIRRYWGESWTAGLVAHEVGHTITSKPGCLELFEAAPFSGDDEKWATAWALSMGYSDGSGTEPYGYPRDDAIAIAAQCR